MILLYFIVIIGIIFQSFWEVCSDIIFGFNLRFPDA